MLDWWRALLVLVAQLQTTAAVTPAFGGAIENFVPTELPGHDFPAFSDSTSNLAWPSGHQPARLSAWPQVGYGTPNRTLLPCWKRTVLHDHSKGWPGLCMNLLRAEQIATETACRNLCWNDPRCPTWQFVNQTVPGQCWVGFGTDCAWRHGVNTAWGQTVAVQAAQRVMHGDVLVLKNLSGLKVNNLWAMGLYHHGAQNLSIERCKAWCYSTISCEYWQYGPGGCYVDAPMWTTENGKSLQNQVQYPLTTNGGVSSNSPDAQTMLWGEYIQHFCPPQLSPTAAPSVPLSAPPTEAPAASGSLLSQWWVWPLLGITILVCGGALAFLLVFRGQGQPKASRTKRGFKGPSEYNDEPAWENTEEKPLMLPVQEVDSRPPAPRMEPTADYSQVHRGYSDPRALGYDQTTPRPQSAAVPRQHNAIPEPTAGYSAVPQQAPQALQQGPQVAMQGGPPMAQQGFQFSAAGAPLYASEATMTGPPAIAQQAVPFPQPGPMQCAQGRRPIQRLY